MKNFIKQIQQQFEVMCATDKLFRSSITGDEIWKEYINGFNSNTNPIFRDPNSSVHNCNLCKNFIRRYGNIVAITTDLKIITMFDNIIEFNYKNSATNIALLLKTNPISNVFFETFNELNNLPYEKCNKTNTKFQLGIATNYKKYTEDEANKYGNVNILEVYTFNHINLQLPKLFVDFSNKSIEAIMANFRDAKNVFQRAMETISQDTLNLVKDLIQQGSLLDGQTHLYKITQILPLKIQYDSLSKSEQDNWCWITSYNLPFAKFRNELIGVLCTELAEGAELNKSCNAWNKRVDPANYMKAIAPITKRQIEEAKQFVEENGYEESFNRRFATIEDIKVSEILHINSGNGTIKEVSIFDSVKSVSTRHKRNEFNNVEEISIEKFMRDILPSCNSIDAYVENRMEGNMVSLTTANIKDSKPIFKWNNNYSWTFNGNLAGKSMIKDNVKAIGGKITGTLRCSLQWNDEDTKGIVDLDLLCITSHCSINFANKEDTKTGGWLDVDMINPSTIGIENIIWQKPLLDGQYKFYVNNYSKHLRHNGFKLEIEFDNQTYNYSYMKAFSSIIHIATISVVNGIISIEHFLPELNSNKNLYGLETNNFHKVNLVCLSPNHWDNNNAGNKHYFFMLDNCKTTNAIRSFHAENLIAELANHRKVLEVLGNTTTIETTNKQLSGLGFNATVKDELIVKVSGSHKRVIKIKF
jgi:hypothetical protein